MAPQSTANLQTTGKSGAGGGGGVCGQHGPGLGHNIDTHHIITSHHPSPASHLLNTSSASTRASNFK